MNRLVEEDKSCEWNMLVIHRSSVLSKMLERLQFMCHARYYVSFEIEKLHWFVVRFVIRYPLFADIVGAHLGNRLLTKHARRVELHLAVDGRPVRAGWVLRESETHIHISYVKVVKLTSF